VVVKSVFIEIVIGISKELDRLASNLKIFGYFRLHRREKRKRMEKTPTAAKLGFKANRSNIHGTSLKPGKGPPCGDDNSPPAVGAEAGRKEQ
jgi:hypothetical protein